MDAPPVQYVRTSDGYDIAYATSGAGRPLVLLPEPFSHIQIYWREVTFMLPLLKGLAERFRLVQYDGRGQGMSERGLREEHSMADEVRDLEAVLHRLRLDRVVLMARRDAAHVALMYALEHPGQVAGLILGSVATRTTTPTNLWKIAETNWESFLLLASPTRATESTASLQRLKQTTTQADYLQRTRAKASSYVGDLLAGIRAPTLVLHPRDFQVYGPEDSLKFAGRIPGATLVTVEGSVGWGDVQQSLHAIDGFVAGLASHGDAWAASKDAAAPAARFSALSAREDEVLRLLAAGRSNQQIADELVISLNTVRRHVSNVFDKTGARNRTEAALYARDHGRA